MGSSEEDNHVEYWRRGHSQGKPTGAEKASVSWLVKFGHVNGHVGEICSRLMIMGLGLRA